MERTMSTKPAKERKEDLKTTNYPKASNIRKAVKMLNRVNGGLSGSYIFGLSDSELRYLRENDPRANAREVKNLCRKAGVLGWMTPKVREKRED